MNNLTRWMRSCLLTIGVIAGIASFSDRSDVWALNLTGGGGAGITESAADDRYVNTDGDTLTGTLVIGTNATADASIINAGTHPVTRGGTGVTSCTDGGVVLGSGTVALTCTAVLADGEVLVGDGTADPAIESGDTLRTSIMGTIGPDLATLGAIGADSEMIVGTGAGVYAYESGDTLRTSIMGVIGPDLTTLGAVSSDGEMIVGTGAGAYAYESGATLRTSIGVGTGDSPTFTALTLSSFTQGSVFFSGASGLLSEDNTNFFWDDTNKRLGIAGTGTPLYRLDVGNLSYFAINGSFAHIIQHNSAASTFWSIAPRNGGDLDIAVTTTDPRPSSGTIGTGDNAISIKANKDVELLANVTMPAQPCFLAFNSVDDANVTGVTVGVTVDFDTEVFDQGSDFAADTFTAPVTGKYLLTSSVQLLGLTTAADLSSVEIVTSNRTYRGNRFDLGSGFPSVLGHTISVVADMDSGDTATVIVTVTGEASDVVDVEGQVAAPVTFFSGCLMA